MPDDIVSFGSKAASRDEALGALFQSCYLPLVRTAFGQAGDWAAAEEIAQQAFWRLRRRWRWRGDREDAPAYLKQAVLKQLAAGTRPGLRPTVAPSDSEHHPSDSDHHSIDIDRAWAQFRRRTAIARQARRSRIAIIASAVVVAAPLVAITVHGMSARPASGPGTSRPQSVRPAVVASIPGGFAFSPALAGSRVWVVTAANELLGISTTTGKAAVRAQLPGGSPSVATYPPIAAVAAGDGMVWLAVGLLGGTRLFEIGPADGHVVAQVDLHGCSSAGTMDGRPIITYGARRLWVGCLQSAHGARGYVWRILRVDPVAHRVDGQSGPIAAPLFWLAASPAGLWFSTETFVIRQVDPVTMRFTGVLLSDSAYPVNFDNVPLIMAGGSLWLLANPGSIFRIDPADGHVLREYPYTSYDPDWTFQANGFAVGGGSVWLLGRTAAPLIRLSIRTGRVLARIKAPWCGGCSLLAVTRHAVWLATGSTIVRLDLARIPS